MSHVLDGKFLDGSLCFVHFSTLPVTTELGTYQVLSKCFLDS